MLVLLQGVLNFIAESEAVPNVLKAGIVVPVYKGGGKDPLKVDSFRGVTLTSTQAKVLEFLIMERLQLLLLEAGFPHIKSVSIQERDVLCRDNLCNPGQYMSGIHLPV